MAEAPEAGPESNYPCGMPTDYTPAEVSALLVQGDVQLVDVRKPHEYAAGHITGVTHIELQELSARADTLDRGRPVVLICRSGGRSAMATEALTQAGFDAHNMAGGMLEWAAAGLTMEPADGHVAEP
jgi:rhodanese-related sulfurtransferase